jgi:hypothetical protein
LIIQEANAIGTAYLRLDTLAAGDQPEMRRTFRDYLDARLRVYQKLPDLSAAAEAEENLNRVRKLYEAQNREPRPRPIFSDVVNQPSNQPKGRGPARE